MSNEHNITQTALKPLESLRFDGSPAGARITIQNLAMAAGNTLRSLHPQHGGKELIFGEEYMALKIPEYITLERKCLAAADAAAQQLLRDKVDIVRTMLCQLMIQTLGNKLSIYSSEVDPLTGITTIETPSVVYLKLQAEFVANSPVVLAEIDNRVNKPITGQNYSELQQELCDIKVKRLAKEKQPEDYTNNLLRD